MVSIHRFMTVQSCDMGSPRYPAAAVRGSLVFAIAAAHTHPYQPMNSEIPNPRLQTRLENLLSLVCKGVLMLIPVLFVVAHIAADGEPWNFATGEKFNPMSNVVSSYAWRSPAGWAMVACMVACMVGFAWVMGFVSWHSAKRGPGFLAWFTALVAAIAMVKMLEVAWYPFKPSRETFHEIQQVSASGPTPEMKQKMWKGGLYAMGVPRPEWVRSPEYLASLRSHWLHQHAIGAAQVMVMLTIMVAKFLWKRPEGGNAFWECANWVVMLWLVAGILGALLLPDLNGVSQRVMYFGFYLWMLIVVRQIQRQRHLGGNARARRASDRSPIGGGARRRVRFRSSG